jgi:predicted N-acetyltransferase YhbS
LRIEWEKAVPEEVFMVVELEQGALDGITGAIKYHKAFEESCDV